MRSIRRPRRDPAKTDGVRFFLRKLTQRPRRPLPGRDRPSLDRSS